MSFIPKQGDDGIHACVSGDRHMSKTQLMAKDAIDCRMQSEEWPFLIVTKTRLGADQIIDALIAEATNRGIRVVSKQPGRITLDGGAVYNVLVQDSMDKWTYKYGYFSDIVMDEVKRK